MHNQQHTREDRSWLSLETDDCPSLLVFDDARTNGWDREECEHLQTCEYCQKTIAASYSVECPSLLALAQSKGLEWPALEQHLAVDNCGFCAARLRSEQVVRLSGEFKAGKSFSERARHFLGRFVGGFLELPRFSLPSSVGLVEGAQYKPLDPLEEVETVIDGVPVLSCTDGDYVEIFVENLPDHIVGAEIYLAHPGGDGPAEPPLRMNKLDRSLSIRLPKAKASAPIGINFITGDNYDEPSPK